MSGVNKAILLGNLGADPEIRTTQNGKQVATLSIATSETYTDSSGARQEKTEWHRVVCFDKTAELAGRYLSKGRTVYVEGKIQTRSWDDKQTGQKKYATEIIARELTFVGGQGGQGNHGGGGPQGGGQGGNYGSGQQAPQGGGPNQQGGGLSGTPQGNYGAPQGGYGGGQVASPPAQQGPAGPDFDDDIPF